MFLYCPHSHRDYKDYMQSLSLNQIKLFRKCLNIHNKYIKKKNIHNRYMKKTIHGKYIKNIHNT